jgi:FAD:protein FMN transferase
VIDEYLHTFSAMGTVVTLHVVGHGSTAARRRERKAAVARAAAWFDEIERTCSRFAPTSELARLSTRVGEPVPSSGMLVEALDFALAVARESDGAFDPTVGARLERDGFNVEHRSGRRVRSNVDPDAGSWRDVHVDRANRTITLDRPVVLDLGAVAKGMAIDMAVRELAPLVNFAVDAGGDLYVAGHNANDRSWAVGIRHPRIADGVFESLAVSDCAVCTSGDYERIADAGTHHLVDPSTGKSAAQCASVTVIAPTAMVADALATAAFVMGPEQGIAFLESQGVDGVIVTPALERVATRALRQPAHA